LKNFMIPTIVASTLAGTSAALPPAQAGEADSKERTAYEQQSENPVKDAWLDGKLETALLFNEHLNSFNIDTDVKNGVAWLNGAVATKIDRDLAGEIAESVSGIREVKNELSIDSSKASEAGGDEESKDRAGFKQAVSDATLTARIKSELIVNTSTSGLAIDVDTKNGAVTLSGEVESEQEKTLVTQIAKNASGTRSVNNRLKVRHES
jgi:hyperosmotically inducible protein